MASGNTLCTFFPYDNEPPSTLYATFDTRNSHPVLGFDTTTQWEAIFTGLLPRHYAGGGITVSITWAAASATSGTIGWLVAFERVGDGSQDTDADNFGSDSTVTAATVPGSSGVTKITSVAMANGSAIASIAVGELFRLRIGRDVANDTALGNAQIFAVELRET